MLELQPTLLRFWKATFVFAVLCVLGLAWATDEKKPAIVQVDAVWTGTNSRFSSLTVGERAFIVYYSAQRKFSVASIDLVSGAVQRIELPGRTPGWDSHDDTKLALDDHGRLHAIFVNHAQPLKYFYSASPLSIADLSPASMTGRNEGHVTYPSFQRLGKRLFLVFRNGVSGNGAWYANVLNGRNWSRLSEAPLFSDRMEDGSVSAYPTPFVAGPNGEINVAIVWRKTPDVASNFRVCFVKSGDLALWKRANGDPLFGTINPTNCDVVDDVGEGQGLVNNAQLNVTTEGTPLIVYTKFDERRRNGIYLAYKNGDWRTVKLISSSTSIDIVGRGSLPGLPAFSAPTIAGGVGKVHVNFPSEAAVDVSFNASALGLADTKSNDVPKFTFPAISTDDLYEPVTLSSVAEPYPPHRYDVVFRWVSQGPHSDIPRSCTDSQPHACMPRPAQLLAYIFKR
ncbi:BNR-4 repeat-containing protein [Bradyrhizobium yuanmingense]|uniref:BNR repeat-containing family member n=1 Tax=Bradyrhizobium yuanmingense TaxID=108015 RepID=A0ABV4G7J4_9BRAD|nr:BNR-4 repeat-containing protein [Bradyrhizobium yuanmingense]